MRRDYSFLIAVVLLIICRLACGPYPHVAAPVTAPPASAAGR